MDFLTQPSIWLYLFVFFGKIIEVAISTLRIMLINRGERVKGSIIAFFEVSLWLLITGTVLVGFREDILRCVVFAVAFALGNYIGAWLESKLAFGLCSINVIVSEQNKAQELADALRSESFAVTVLDGEGKDGQREILVLHLKRKRIPSAVAIVKKKLKSPMITINDVRVVKGGFIKK